METTFENAGVGDKVWSVAHGWGIIQSIESAFERPVDVRFENGRRFSFCFDGKLAHWHVNRMLFWNAVTLPEAPVKPKKKVMRTLEVNIKKTHVGWQIIFPQKQDMEKYFLPLQTIKFTSELIEIEE